MKICMLVCCYGIINCMIGTSIHAMDAPPLPPPPKLPAGTPPMPDIALAYFSRCSVLPLKFRVQAIKVDRKEYAIFLKYKDEYLRYLKQKTQYFIKQLERKRIQHLAKQSLNPQIGITLSEREGKKNGRFSLNKKSSNSTDAQPSTSKTPKTEKVKPLSVPDRLLGLKAIKEKKKLTSGPWKWKKYKWRADHKRSFTRFANLT